MKENQNDQEVKFEISSDGSQSNFKNVEIEINGEESS